MAAVSARERGQLVLVGGLSLAVVLVVLALVLNTAIYTENVASRDVDSGASDALAARHAAIEGAGVVMDGTNDRGEPAGYGTLETDFGGNVTRWSESAAGYAAVEGRSLQVDQSGTLGHGVRVVDDSSGSFVPRDGTTLDWTVAAASHVRAFELTVTGATSASRATVSDGLGDGVWDDDDVFSVDFGAGVGVAVYNDSATDRLTVGVYDGATGTYAECSETSGTELRVDFGRGTVNGVECEALGTLDDQTGPTDVRFANGDRVTGTYELTIDRAIDDTSDPNGTFTDAVDRANYGDSCTSTYHLQDGSSYPAVAPALYAGSVDVSYRAESIAYDETVRIAPGEVGTAAAATPQVVSYAIDDRSDSSQVEFVVDWSVADPDGDLAAVTVALDDVNGTEIRSDTTAVGGTTASGTTTVGAPTSLTGIVVDDPYDVRITVEDTAGETRSAVRRHVADGDDTGCPP